MILVHSRARSAARFSRGDPIEATKCLKHLKENFDIQVYKRGKMDKDVHNVIANKARKN